MMIDFDDDLVNRYKVKLDRLAQYYSGGDYTLKKDLIQEGWIGVSIACEQWRSEFGASLETYAYYKVRDRMQRYIRHCLKVVSEPRRDKVVSKMVSLDDVDPPSEEWTEYIDLGEALESLDWLTRELVIEHVGKGVTILALSAVHGMCRNRCSRMIKKGMKQLKGQLS